jgi:hypothetical protein
MELDELKLAWHSLDAKVDAAHRMHVATVRELKMERAHSALRPLALLIILELSLAIVALLWLGGFLAQYWNVARYAIPGAALHICAILTLVNAVYQLTIVGQIDFSGPVVGAQSMLTKLTAQRARAARCQLLLAALLWTPFAIVVARGLLGFDVYRVFGWSWINVNLAFGVAMIPLLSWIARRFGDRLQQAGFVKRMSDHIAGRSLQTSMRVLEEIAAFERVQGK